MANFSDSRSVLNKKPRIQFVEPAQVPGEDQVIPAQEDIPASIEQIKQRTEEVVAQYDRLEKLSDLAQDRIDKRAKDMQICLDRVVDAEVIISLKRKFKTSVPCITYQQYKQCLQELAQSGQAVAPMITASDIERAKKNPLKTDFGGYGKTDGQLRPELLIPSPIQPIDLDEFQKEIIKKLFQMMLPLISGFVDSKIS